MVKRYQPEGVLSVDVGSDVARVVDAVVAAADAVADDDVIIVGYRCVTGRLIGNHMWPIEWHQC